MENFVVFDPAVHRSAVVDLCESYFDWIACELQKDHGIDVYLMIGTTMRDYVKNNVDEFTFSISTGGILYLIQV